MSRPEKAVISTEIGIIDPAVRDTTVYSWLSGESRPKNPECIERFLIPFRE